MSEKLFDEIKSYVGFTGRDIEQLAGVAPVLRASIPRVVDAFYDVLLLHPEARAVFTGGDAQIARQRELLGGWLSSLFSGTYDQRYVESRLAIGTTHVRVGLPQRFMVLGMEIVWRELLGVLGESGKADTPAMRAALHKLLTLDLTIMLQSYQESYIEKVRSVERVALEAKLMRAEHLAEIGQLAASLAHEIKNPLAGISGAIQIIGASMDERDPHRNIVREILGQIGRLDATVKDLLLYARPPMPRPRELGFHPLVARVHMLLREEPAVRRVQVEFDVQGSDAAVYADEGQMEQLLMNLILNAAHASEAGGVIHVAARPSPSGVSVSVRDAGHGMKPEVMAKAVEPFFTTKAKGTGLGLAICRKIAEAHGGAIRIESTVGQGTTVFVDLPGVPSLGSGKV